MPGPPRSRPWPYDAILSGTGVMLAQGKDGSLVATKSHPFDQQAPDAYQYDLANPEAERVQPYTDLTLGFGLKVQNSYEDKKYRYAVNADLSVGGVWLKGPALGSLLPATVDTTHGITDFVEMGGSLYAVNGRYILKRSSDSSWTATDLGNGKSVLGPNAAAVFTSSGSGTSYIWLPMAGTDLAMYFDGTSATAMAAHVSLAYRAVGSDFYRASSINSLSKVDRAADPTNEGNWGAANAFSVGDKSSPIVSLSVDATGGMEIFKGDGIYTIDQSGQDAHLYPFLAQGSGGDDGKYWGSVGNDTHVTYGKSHFRLVPTVLFGTSHLVIEEIGPERFTENDSPVKGRITAIAANGPLGAYAGLYDDDLNQSWLLKFGAWQTAAVVAGQLEESKKIDAWHGAICPVFSGVKLTALYRSGVGAPTNHERMYMGFSDGTIKWFTLPCVPNPAACARDGGVNGYAFSTADGTVNLPLFHGTFEADAHTLRAVTVINPAATSTEYVQLNYKPDVNASNYTALGTNFTGAPRQKVTFPNNSYGYLSDFQVVLKSTTTGASPQVTAFAIHHSVRPALVLEYDLSVLAVDGLAKRDGRPFHLGARAIRSAVIGAAQAFGSVTLILPEETSKQVSVTDYKEAYAWHEPARRWTASLAVHAIEFMTNTTYGTVGRLSGYGSGDLAVWSVGALGGI